MKEADKGHDVYETVQIAATKNNVHRSGSIRLGSLDTQAYLNIYGFTGTIQPEEAKQLRDALIRIYPIEAAV